MRLFWKNSIIGSLLILSSVLCRAENDTIPHVLADLATPPLGITFSDGNRVGTTDLLTYTCSGGADFGTDLEGGGVVSIRIPNTKGAKFTTTALEELTGVVFYYYPSKTLYTLALEVSRDSTEWTRLEAPNFSCIAGVLRGTVPRGTYYVRVRNTDTNERMSIFKMYYIFSRCNCLVVEE